MLFRSRFDQDISSLCGCFNVEVAQDRVIAARIAYGGMAGTPKRALAVERALIGKPWTRATIIEAMLAYGDDFSPLGDMRGSSDYRLLAARNLLLKLFEESRAPLGDTRLVGRGSALT